MPPIGLIGPSYTLRTVNIDCQRCVNLYVELDETQQGRAIGALYGTPGLQLFATVDGVEGIRPKGLYTTATGRCFAVRGATFAEVFPDGTTAALGSLLTRSGPMSIRDNTLQLVLVDGLYGYSLDLSTNLLMQITDEAFLGADRVDYIDSYLIFNRPQTNQFYFTSPVSITLNGLDFYSLLSTPDLLISLLVNARELWLFKATSTEVWVTTGDGTSPFSRVQGVAFDIGCEATQSPTQFSGSLCWLGIDARGARSVWEAQGYQPQRISTHAIEQALDRYATTADAIGWAETWEGHVWYVLTFPTADATWVYDLTTKLWHERATLNQTTGILHRHQANAHTYAFGKHLMGDCVNGSIYQASLDVYTDNGVPLKRVRRFPYVPTRDESPMPHDRLQLDIEGGVGLQAIDPGTGSALPPGVSPQLALRWSNDYGHTWSMEHWVSAGPVGAYRQRAIWNRLGTTPRSRVYEVSTTAPVKQAWVGAFLNPEAR